MENKATISHTSGHYKGGVQVQVQLPAQLVHSTSYSVKFQSVTGHGISTSVKAAMQEDGQLVFTLPDHGQPDVTTVSVVGKQPSCHFMTESQFHFLDPLSVLVSACDPSYLEDLRTIAAFVLTQPHSETEYAAGLLDIYMVECLTRRPPLIASIEVKSIFEGSKICYSNDKATLFHFAADLGLPRLAEMLTQKDVDLKYSLKTELLRRTSGGLSPLACARKNSTDKGREVKLVYAETIAELNEAKHDKVWPAGKSSKKDKPRTKSWSDRPTRLEADAVDSEGEGIDSSTSGKIKRRRTLWNKKKDKGGSKLEGIEILPFSTTKPPAKAPEGLVYSITVLNASSGSDAESGRKGIPKQTIQYFWDNAKAFYEVKSDYQPNASDRDAGVLPLQPGEVAIAVEKDGVQPKLAYGLVNNEKIGLFPLGQVTRISSQEAQTNLMYHHTRKTASLPSLKAQEHDRILTEAPSPNSHTLDEYEVMKKYTLPLPLADRVQTYTLQWYKISHQAEIIKDTMSDASATRSRDFLQLPPKSIVNVVCMPDNEEWALVEHCGMVGRSFYAQLRSLPEKTPHILQDPIHLDKTIGCKALQPGDVVAVGIAHSNKLKIAAIQYGDDAQETKPEGNSSRNFSKETIYDVPEAGQGKVIGASPNLAAGNGSDTSSQGDVGTGFDEATDFTPKNMSPSHQVQEAGTAQGQGSGSQWQSGGKFEVPSPGLSADTHLQPSSCDSPSAAWLTTTRGGGNSTPIRALRLPLKGPRHAFEKSLTLPTSADLSNRGTDSCAVSHARSPSTIESLVDSISAYLDETPTPDSPSNERPGISLKYAAASPDTQAPPNSPQQQSSSEPSKRLPPSKSKPPKATKSQSPDHPSIILPKANAIPLSLNAKPSAPPVSPKPCRRPGKKHAVQSLVTPNRESPRLDTVRRSISTEMPSFKSVHLPPTSHEPDGVTSPSMHRRAFPLMKVALSVDRPSPVHPK